MSYMSCDINVWPITYCCAEAYFKKISYLEKFVISSDDLFLLLPASSLSQKLLSYKNIYCGINLALKKTTTVKRAYRQLPTCHGWIDSPHVASGQLPVCVFDYDKKNVNLVYYFGLIKNYFGNNRNNNNKTLNVKTVYM